MEQKTIKVSRKKLLWIVIILIIIGLWWTYQKPYYEILPTMMGGSYDASENVSSPASGPNTSMMEKLGTMIYPDYYRTNPDITDTRQFLKTNYSADIKTRNVKDMIRDIRNIVRDVDGRIDSIQESEKYSYVSFVVPKSKFDVFRDEIENLTHEKLITVNVSSENLLGQKQSIEEQMQNATSTLANLEKQKKTLVIRHNQVLTDMNTELASLQNQIPYPTERALAIQQNIDNENRSYNSQNQNLTNSIEQFKAIIARVEKQDTQFGNNIETVSGYIAVNWVTYWQIIKIFSPIHPSIIIIVLLAIFWRILSYLRMVPKIELV